MLQQYRALPTHRQYSLALIALSLLLLAIGIVAIVTQGHTVPASAAPEAQQAKISYSFTAGSLITEPAQDFCTYYKCIASFWNGRGYVVQCGDGMFSLSGGMHEACSYHGGVWRALYAH